MIWITYELERSHFDAYLWDVITYSSDGSALLSMDISILAFIVFYNGLVSCIVVLVLRWLDRCQLLHDYLSFCIILLFNLLDQFLSLRSRRERSFTLFVRWRIVRTFVTISTSRWFNKTFTWSSSFLGWIFWGGTGKALLFGNWTRISIKSCWW
jgi:hypothetical protein